MTCGSGAQSACASYFRLRKRETTVQEGGGVSWSAKTTARDGGEDSGLTDGGSLGAMWVSDSLRVRQRKTPAMIKMKKKISFLQAAD